ncbi:MAG: type IV pilus modification protein PilV [Gammaproteobacteria bacterium]|nr:type IV pilus modification protein PilV [Gammaproteobacteria bacterium]
MNQSHTTQRGVGIIEVLIALVLISAGFLAAAQMQMRGMQYSQSAYSHSQAYFMATEIMDRMRANTEGMMDGAYNNRETSAVLIDPQCGTNPCNAAEIAQQDLYDWSANLHDLTDGVTNFQPVLPSSDAIAARGVINALGGGFFQIVIEWSESDGGGDVMRQLSVNLATEIPQ